jgi:hypothetical protein
VLGCLVGIVDCVLQRGREAAGDRWHGDVLRVMEDSIDLRRVGPRQLIRGMRRRKAEMIGGEGEARAHRWR